MYFSAILIIFSLFVFFLAWTSRFTKTSSVPANQQPCKNPRKRAYCEESQLVTPQKKVKYTNPTEPWIPELGLIMQDKADIQNGKPVAFPVAQAAVTILKKQFQEKSGLPCIRMIEEHVLPVYKPTIQLHIDWEEGHSFVTACDGKEIIIMADSELVIDYGSLRFQQIHESYKRLLKDPISHIQYLKIQQQHFREKACVMYSAANMYELLTPGGNPECRYIKKHLRPHFIQCLENKIFTEFPKRSKAPPPSKPHFDWQNRKPRGQKRGAKP